MDLPEVKKGFTSTQCEKAMDIKFYLFSTARKYLRIVLHCQWKCSFITCSVCWSFVVICGRTVRGEGGTQKWGQRQGEKGNRMDHSEYDVFGTVREVHCTVAVNYAFPQPQHTTRQLPQPRRTCGYAGTPRRSMKIQTN